MRTLLVIVSIFIFSICVGEGSFILRPVDFDPFAEDSVPGKKANVKLRPVDFDPFAEETTEQYVNMPPVEPKGVINKLKEKIQGVKFWENELKKTDNELEECKAFAKNMVQSWKDSILLSRDVDHEINTLYHKHPDLAPSKAQKNAARLRQKADLIEDIGGMVELIKINNEKIQTLKKYRKQVVSMIQRGHHE